MKNTDVIINVFMRVFLLSCYNFSFQLFSHTDYFTFQNDLTIYTNLNFCVEFSDVEIEMSLSCIISCYSVFSLK